MKITAGLFFTAFLCAQAPQTTPDSVPARMAMQQERQLARSAEARASREQDTRHLTGEALMAARLEEMTAERDTLLATITIMNLRLAHHWWQSDMTETPEIKKAEAMANTLSLKWKAATDRRMALEIQAKPQ